MPFTHDEDLLAADAAALAEGLASFVKAYFIYPPNNSRVGEALEDCMHKLRSVLERSAPLRFAVTQDRVEVGETILEWLSAPVIWLADVFRRTGLGVVEFHRDLRPDDLREFADALRSAVAKVTRNPRARDLWPEAVGGLVLEKTRLCGRFAPAVGKEGGPSEEDGCADGPGRSRSTRPAGSRQFSKLIADLIAVEEVARRLAVLEEALKRSKDGPAIDRVDILEQILRLVPPGTRRDTGALVWTVETVLGHVLSELEHGCDQGRLTVDDIRFRRALLEIGYAFFGRSERHAEETRELVELPVGSRPGDELINEDLDLLLEEFEALPDSPPGQLTMDDCKLERVSVCLYEIATRSGDEAPGRAREELAALLAAPDPETEAMVRAHLDPTRGDLPPHVREQRVERVLDFLEEAAVAGLAERVVDLGVDVVERRFPERFGVFLDSLDLDDPADRVKLVEVVTRLGRRRIRSAGAEAMRVLSSSPRRLQTVFTVRNRAFLPFAEVVVAHGDPHQVAAVVGWLRCLDLPGGEAAVLLLDDPPRPFLHSLCAEAYDGLYTKATTDRARNLLRGFVGSPADSQDGIERRTLAVYALWKLWNDDLLACVRRLCRGSGLFGRGWPPAPIRQAAREVLRWHKERKT